MKKVLRNIIRHSISFIRYPKLFLYSKGSGKNIWLGKGGLFIRPEEIFFGDNIFIASGFHISARNLKIGDNVLIGPKLLIECDNHIFNNIGKTIWSTKEKRNTGFITIENDVWVGGNVTILKDVIIGEGCIIGAASVVTKSLPPYSVCFGTPCRPYKVRFNEEELRNHLALVNSEYTPYIVIKQWEENGLI